MPIEALRMNSIINKSLPFRGNEKTNTKLPSEEKHMSESAKLLIGAGSVAAIAIATIAIIKSKNKKNGDIVDKTLNKGKEEVKNVFKGFKDKLVELLEKTPPVFKKGKKATIEYKSGAKRIDSFLDGERISEYLNGKGKLVRRVGWTADNKVSYYEVYVPLKNGKSHISRSFYRMSGDEPSLTYVNKFDKSGELIQVRQSDGVIRNAEYNGKQITKVESTKEGNIIETLTVEYNDKKSPLKLVKKDADGKVILIKEAIYTKDGKKPASLTITTSDGEPRIYLFRYPKGKEAIIVDKATNKPVEVSGVVEDDLTWKFL